MNLDEILKQINFPFTAYYSGKHKWDESNKRWRERKFVSKWEDVYEIFNISPKNTLMDISPYTDESATILMIGKANELFLFKEETQENFTVRVKQSLQIINELSIFTPIIWIQHVEKIPTDPNMWRQINRGHP